MPSPTDVPSHVDDARARTSPWTGVLPVSLVVLLVGGMLVLLLPRAREEAALSLSRQPVHYVALSFTDPTRARSCPTVDRAAAVDVSVQSNLAEAAAVDYRITVTSSTGRVRSTAGSVDTTPGRSSAVRRTVRAPASLPYVLRVELPGRDAAVQVRCERGGPS